MPKQSHTIFSVLRRGGAPTPRRFALQGVRYSGPMWASAPTGSLQVVRYSPPFRQGGLFISWKAGRERSAVLPRPGGLE